MTIAIIAICTIILSTVTFNIVLNQKDRQIKLLKSLLEDKEASLNAYREYHDTASALINKQRAEIDAQREAMRVHGEALDYAVEAIVSLKEQIKDTETALNLAIRQLERASDNEFCVMVDIRNENGETTNYFEEIYYSAEAAAKAYMAYAAQYGEDFVSIT